ncbi:MAG TPA: EAL domain-containing protein [Candidatus Acidoferrum sp.]|nr:EAL domain-containing protein [Candidatus Acidoferrum sp.]
MNPQLGHLATHDPLTECFTRHVLEEQLKRQLAHARRYGACGALLFLNVDQFKDINSSLGHVAGDQLLTSLAGLLRERVRGTDCLARVGGDTFAILLPQTDGQQAGIVAEHLLQRVQGHSIVIAGQPLSVTARIGLVVFPDHGTTVGRCLARAESALGRAKEQGRNCVTVYAPDEEVEARAVSRLGWQGRLREAVAQDRFQLVAQPVLDLRHNRVAQYELLLRLAGEGGEVVLPGAFLEVAEQIGMIHDIDRWVVRQAINLLTQERLGSPPLTLEVNLSAKAFGDTQLLPLIARELTAAALRPGSLVLEVTETAAITNIHQAQAFIRTLKGLGCRFALDDFGVGFSSFAHLKHLPVDFVKLDGSFIRNLARDPLDRHLVRAMVEVARGLGQETIAEYVEDSETLRLLRE